MCKNCKSCSDDTEYIKLTYTGFMYVPEVYNVPVKEERRRNDARKKHSSSTACQCFYFNKLNEDSWVPAMDRLAIKHYLW